MKINSYQYLLVPLFCSNYFIRKSPCFSKFKHSFVSKNRLSAVFFPLSDDKTSINFWFLKVKKVAALIKFYN